MVHISVREWQMASAAAGAALVGGVLWWLLTRRRPTEDELEQARRETLMNFGRIVDGMLLDAFQIENEDEPGPDGAPARREMLLYQYEISGVSYECSQDVTLLPEVVNPHTVKVGMPCTIRYQPAFPENSILVSERWSGLRDGVPVIWIPPSDPEGHRAKAGLRAV